MRKIRYDIENSFGSIVRRADTALINRLNQKFKNAGYNITTEQYRLVVNLWNKDGQNQQELAETTRKNKTSMTRLINGLEKRNLVIRVPDQKDHRNKCIYLTPKGKNLPRHLTKLAKETLQEALRGLPSKQLESCRKVLMTITENLR